MAAKNMKSILIIEDEPDICLLLNIMLADDDTNINQVKNIKAAKTYLDTNSPDLIVLDNKLPDGLGIDFIKDIKYHAPQSKILMISGAGAEVKDLALENGANAFLEKPFSRSAMHKEVAALLSKEESFT